MLRKEKEGLELIPQKQKLFGLILTIPLSQIYHKKTRQWLVILKLQDQGQKNIDLRMFCEKLPLWFSISSESYVFP